MKLYSYIPLFKKFKVLRLIKEFYLNSKDYNGILLSKLIMKTGLSWKSLRKTLTLLLKKDRITLTFTDVSINPHIKRFPDLPKVEQIEKLCDGDPDTICAYPSKKIIKKNIDNSKYINKPFSKSLFLGNAQLQPMYFDLAALERYFNDPRYTFKYYDYGGSVSIADEYSLSDETLERDKTFIESFGLGYIGNKNRVVAVFLCYLAKLTEEHQQYWNTYIINEECRMSRAYYENSILGKWVMDISYYQAFLLEQFVINEISSQMARPLFFRVTYDNDRPKEFSNFLRPTYGNFQKFVLILDKLLSENINKKFFKNDVPFRKESKSSDRTMISQDKGTLLILEEWLKKFVKTSEFSEIDHLIDVFKNIRKLRQKPAHVIEKDEFDISYYNMQNKLIIDAYNACKRRLKIVPVAG